MDAYNLILKKKNGLELSASEIEYLIKNYSSGALPDYQMSAFLMAICWRGMSEQETVDLTTAMINTGKILKLTEEFDCLVDKHSTGGVGDTTSLIVSPIVAAAGCVVAKMSGRGLGHTGGTLDKLESLPGFNIDLTNAAFINQLKQIGLAIIGQTSELAPVDKKMYALRDVTATVDSIPLIASSIMSKKIAAGAPKIVLDVKVGSGSFMKSVADARKLADIMVQIGRALGKDVIAVLSNMNNPLGMAVGNILEVKEAIDFLNGNYSDDLFQLCLELSVQILISAGKCRQRAEAVTLVNRMIDSRKALDKLAEMVEMQGGEQGYIYDTSRFPSAAHIVEIKSTHQGYIAGIDALMVGRAAMELGAGRATKKDEIDLQAGIKLLRKSGDYVRKGQVIAEMHTNKPEKTAPCQALFLNAVTFCEEKPKSCPSIIEIIT